MLTIHHNGNTYNYHRGKITPINERTAAQNERYALYAGIDCARYVAPELDPANPANWRMADGDAPIGARFQPAMKNN